MEMTTTKLIALRLFNISVGRFELLSKFLREILLKMLIDKPVGERYVASSKYFDIRELDS